MTGMWAFCLEQERQLTVGSYHSFAILASHDGLAGGYHDRGRRCGRRRIDSDAAD